ncbi:UNVERIFIED_CONTAM: zinc finger protein [Trichonephila clavipes]
MYLREVLTEQQGYVCTTCSKWFSACSTLKKHKIWHHKSEFPPFKYCCVSCPYATNKSTNFKTHVHVHLPNRPFQCTQCGNGFKTLSSLNNHKLIHKGERYVGHGPVLRVEKRDNAELISKDKHFFKRELPEMSLVKYKNYIYKISFSFKIFLQMYVILTAFNLCDYLIVYFN